MKVLICLSDLAALLHKMKSADKMQAPVADPSEHVQMNRFLTRCLIVRIGATSVSASWVAVAA